MYCSCCFYTFVLYLFNVYLKCVLTVNTINVLIVYTSNLYHSFNSLGAIPRNVPTSPLTTWNLESMLGIHADPNTILPFLRANWMFTFIWCCDLPLHTHACLHKPPNITVNVMRQPVMGHFSIDPALGGSWTLVISATYWILNITFNVLQVSFLSRIYFFCVLSIPVRSAMNFVFVNYLFFLNLPWTLFGCWNMYLAWKLGRPTNLE